MGRNFTRWLKNFGRKVASGEAWEEYKQAQTDAERAAADAGIDLGAQRPGKGQVEPDYGYGPHEPTRKFIKKHVTDPYDTATDWVDDKVRDVGDFGSGVAGEWTAGSVQQIAKPKVKKNKGP